MAEAGMAGVEREMPTKPDYAETTYRGSERLAGKVALVTGGDSGIGRAVSLAFAREGADVLISYLDEHDDARESVRLVEEAGRRAIAAPGDIGGEPHCRSLVERTVEELGRLDVLVNNAAYQMERTGIDELPAEDVERVFRTNVLSMFWLCRAAVPHLRPGSAIVNTTSIQAYDPSPVLLDYATTKGAIVTFTKGLAKELVERGIRVNAVAPGPVWTPLVTMSFSDRIVRRHGDDTPIGRAAQPAEIAPAFVFLASDESRHVVGEVLGVTGGLLMPS
jgi:hypothetical protein